MNTTERPAAKYAMEILDLVQHQLGSHEFITVIVQNAINNALRSREGWQLVPTEPPEAMWSGLARSIMMWMDMSNGPKLPRDLLTHLRRSGVDAPQWLLDEPEMKTLDHSMSKGGRCVLIYKAMLYDIPGASI